MTGKTNSNTVNGVGERKATLICNLQWALNGGDSYEIQPNGTVSMSHRIPGNDQPITIENGYITARIDRYQNTRQSPTGKSIVVTLKKRCYVTAGGLKGITDNVYDVGTVFSWDINGSATSGDSPRALDNRTRFLAGNQAIVISEV